MSDHKYTLWFDQTYSDTYLTVRRAGRILLAHLCPALLGDLDELLDNTYSDMSRKEWLLRRHPNITGWLIVAFRYVVYHRIRVWYREQRILERYKNEQRASRAIDPFAEAMLLTEAEDIMVAGDRGAALRAPARIPIRRRACEGTGGADRQERPRHGSFPVALAENLSKSTEKPWEICHVPSVGECEFRLLFGCIGVRG